MIDDKIADVHRHLGGSIKPEFVWNIIKENPKYKYLASSQEDVERLMVCGSDRSMTSFLNKFTVLDEIVWTEQLIDDSIKHILQGMKQENLYGALIDFSINKYMKIGWHKKEAIRFIKQSFDRHKENLKIGLVLSIKYENPSTTIKQYIDIIDEPDIVDCLAGIDFVGNEHFYDKNIIQGPLQKWHKYGKMVRAHVGEAGPVENIKSAILDLKVTNIAHGIKILQEPELIEIAIDNDIQFDLGIKGNHCTGVSDIYDHPISDMIYNGLKVTIGTDDPVQFNTTMQNEFNIFRTIYKHRHIEDELDEMKKNAVDTIDKYVTSS